MATFEDGKEAWKTNLRRTRLLKEGVSVNQLLDGRHVQQHFGTDEPTLVSANYTQIFTATDRYHGKMLLGMTEATGRVKEINSDTFRWTLSGGNTEYPRIVAVACTDPKPGLNKTPVDIIVDKPYFNVSDIIQPENNEVRCLVVVPDGTGSRAQRPEAGGGYRYTIILLDESASAFIPAQYIQEGHEWNQVSSAVATESNPDGGGFNFYAVFESDQVTQQHAKKYSVTDKAARRMEQAKRKGLGKCDIDGCTGVGSNNYSDITNALWVKSKTDNSVKPTYHWLNAFDAELLDKLHQDVENTLMFGKRTRGNYSAEGYEIMTASGLREQIQTGHVMEHNGSLDIAMVENWFDAILKHRISESNRNIVLSAGYQFRILFDKMIKEESRTFTTIDTLFIRKGEDFRNLHFGSYFSTYSGYSVDISVTENAAYDNRDFCRRTLPGLPNTPVDSLRADILDFAYMKEQGTGMTTDNICMVHESYLNYNIRSNGKWDGKSCMPITDGGVGTTGTDVSGFSFLVEKNAGLMVCDPSRCGTIKYAG